jgi:hypothetical protein
VINCAELEKCWDNLAGNTGAKRLGNMPDPLDTINRAIALVKDTGKR